MSQNYANGKVGMLSFPTSHSVNGFDYCLNINVKFIYGYNSWIPEGKLIWVKFIGANSFGSIKLGLIN